LINNLHNNNIEGVTDPILLVDQLKSGSSHQSIIGGTLNVVLQNENIIKSTHVSFATLASALEEVSAVCCGSFPMCIKGTATVIGDDGAGVTLHVNNINDNPLFG
jgi:hypothetical protein